jgi:hypothetical protein
MRHVWLDFENGDLKPSELSALFPYVSMVITNTFRHTKQNPRFRAIIATSGRVTPAAYQLIWDSVAKKLEDAGYSVSRDRKLTKHQAELPRSGLDWSKRPAASLFYLPSQAEDPAQSFFEVYDGGNRSPLDVLSWIENSVVEPKVVRDPEPLPERQDNPAVNQEGIASATAQWRMSSNYPGEGNARFYRFAQALRRAGLSLIEVQAILLTEARFGRSSAKRIAQIPSIVISLRTYGWDDPPST